MISDFIGRARLGLGSCRAVGVGPQAFVDVASEGGDVLREP